MDSNNNSSGSSDGDIGCHFLPTSTTSPHFLDLPPPFPLDSFPHLLSSPPPAITITAQRPKTEPNIPSSVGPTTRPSKKRSRASRRAPTTVLTTDTSNFRAMVQEFTGIPAPPFSSASLLHFPGSFNLNPSPLLKPYPHKFPTNPEFDFRPNSIDFHSQLVNLPQPPAPGLNSNSGGLDLPGIIGPGRETRNLNFSVPGPISSTATAEFHVEKGEGLMESWICSSD